MNPELSKDMVDEIYKLIAVFNEANAEIPKSDRQSSIMAALVFLTIQHGKTKMKYKYDEIAERFAVSIALHEAIGG